MQEKIGLTAETKCIETFVLIAFAVLVVKFNKEMFSNKLSTQ